MANSSLTPEKSKAIVILVGGIIVVIILAVYINKTFGGISKFFGSISDALGITDSPERAALKQTVADAKAQSSSPNSAWSPAFYKNAPSGAHLLTQSAMDAIAGQVWDSVGIFSGWDINQAIAAIKQLQYKSQVSYLSDRFNSLYNKDLLSWLTLQYTSPLGGADPGLAIIFNYVSSLPNY